MIRILWALILFASPSPGQAQKVALPRPVIPGAMGSAAAAGAVLPLPAPGAPPLGPNLPAAPRRLEPIAAAARFTALGQLGLDHQAWAPKRRPRVTAFFFDIDDNLFTRLPTKIILFRKATGEELPISTEDFAAVADKIGAADEELAAGGRTIRAKDWEFRRVPGGSFREFKDEDGKNNFLPALKAVVEGMPESAWQGPSWQAFVHAMSDPGTALQTAIITARGHRPESYIEAFRYLQAKGYIKHVPAVERMFGVDGTPDRSKAKLEVLSGLLDRIQAAPFGEGAGAIIDQDGTGRKALHSAGFSDDDWRTISVVAEGLKAAMLADPRRWDKVKIMLFFTGSKHPTQGPGVHVLTSKGELRPAKPRERGESLLIAREPAAARAAAAPELSASVDARPDAVVFERRGIPAALAGIYEALPDGALRRLSEDPLAAALDAAGIDLWSVRHGETETNRARLVAGGGTDAALTRTPDGQGVSGERQARAAALRMYRELGGDAWARAVAAGSRKPVVILTSPLERARRTGEAFQELLERKRRSLGLGSPRPLYEIHVERGLSEIAFGGLEAWPLERARKLAGWSAFDAVNGAGRTFLDRFPGGESRFDVLIRQRAVIRRMIRAYPGRQVVAFAHFETVAAQKALLGLLDVDPADQALKVAPIPNAEPIRLRAAKALPPQVTAAPVWPYDPERGLLPPPGFMGPAPGCVIAKGPPGRRFPKVVEAAGATYHHLRNGFYIGTHATDRDIAGLFEALAPDYERREISVPYNVKVYAGLAGLAVGAHRGADVRSVLDFGSGTGVGAGPLRRAFPGARLYGFDLSPAMRAQSGRKGLTPVGETAGRLDLADASVDLAVGVFVLHLVRSPEWIRELGRALASGIPMPVLVFRKSVSR